ncbi:MAG: TPM domain-containing protein [Chthoniobacteraceae bacterium]
MKAKDFLSRLDEPRIVAAIVNAERRTSGEIRVWISSREIEDPVARAQQRFEQIGMSSTRERNGVLLYLAPHSQKFAIIGDSGIHEKCGAAFWEELVAQTAAELRADRFTDAIVNAIHKAGELLARHFPARPDDRNELPNEIVRD